MSNIKIENPWLLFVALGLIIAILIGFFMLPKQKRSRPKNLISLGLHIVISITLALAFANIQTLQTSHDVEVYAVVDCSDSESANAEKLNTLVQDLYKQAGEAKAKVGVVAYGKNQVTLAKAGDRIASDAITKLFDSKDATIDRSASDIASALTYTNNLFSDNVGRRMVLISDGFETDGSAIDTIQTLLSNDVQLDTVSVEQNPKYEVAVTGIEYTDHAFVGRTETVKISVRSTRTTDCVVELTSNGNLIDNSNTKRTISKGLNVITYTLPTDKAGSFDYQITLSPESDTFVENNTMGFTQTCDDDFKVLFLSGETKEDEMSALQEIGIYTDSDQVTYSFEYMNVPYKTEDFVQYDEIVLSNFNVSKLDEEIDTSTTPSIAKQFVSNLKAAVSVYGKSLLTFGDTYTGLNNSDYAYMSDFGDILPIQSHSEGGKAVIFLIDVSGSMETDNRIGMAKKGCIAALDTFSDEDMVGVTTFESDTHIIKPLTSIRNKDEIAAAVNKLTSMGGTVMGAALKQCGKQLNNSTAEFKTIITLSDGDPFDNDSDLFKIVRNLAADNITCSFINISNKSGESRLKKMATYGNGNYYYVRSAQQLVDVMVNSVSEEITKIHILQDDTQIVIRNGDDAVLANTGNDFPTIDGFNYCRIKPQANTILTSTYIKTQTNDDGDETTVTYNVPLYAYWSYGKGTISSFTANIAGDDISYFRASAAGKQFFKNMQTTSLPERSTKNFLDMTYDNYGTTSTVKVNPNNGDYTGKITIKVKDPDNKEETYELLYDGSDYSCSIAMNATGKYTVEISYYESTDGVVSSTETATATLPLYFDYSKEYNFFSQEENDLMYRLAKQCNGANTSNSIEYGNSESEIAYSSYFSWMMIFLLISVILFLIDIFIRKSDFLFKKRLPGDTNATIQE